MSFNTGTMQKFLAKRAESVNSPPCSGDTREAPKRTLIVEILASQDRPFSHRAAYRGGKICDSENCPSQGGRHRLLSGTTSRSGLQANVKLRFRRLHLLKYALSKPPREGFDRA